MKTKIQKLLRDISLLLAENDEKKWAANLNRFNEQLDLDYEATLSNIKRLSGGAGSFNDLVLHYNGQMLKRENNQLNILQNQLYEVLKQETISRRSC
ncbi:hypothetical protein COO59_08875 [Mixta theicola]|uniref:DUF6966 domain-containing protein n=1 Tax=Mixta theicola TaxID=1458355 RepID=A0A2K1QAM0_9GAMM|nr:hypothetical protein [Mixta theicola]PNS12084.1 hypothetical protein COO59_08875 [Mixta theicola]GLR10751.1 hypothetical protein GCM10007905_34710 [Mixta theicola]